LFVVCCLVAPARLLARQAASANQHTRPHRLPSFPSKNQNKIKASDRGPGLQADALTGLIFGRLLPALDAAGLTDLLEFLGGT
jgi:hypothetical protein